MYAADKPANPPKAARVESIHQAHRWDINKNKAVQFGLCDACAGQYAWGIQIGFTLSRPPCLSCSELVNIAIGAVKPNGWKVLPRTPRHSDARKRSGAPEFRLTDPAKGIDGYGRATAAAQSGRVLAPATARRAI